MIDPQLLPPLQFPWRNERYSPRMDVPAADGDVLLFVC